MSSASLLRSCTAALAAPTRASTLRNARRPAAELVHLSRRNYSDDKGKEKEGSEPADAAKPASEGTAEGAGASAAETELAAKLKAKEAEAVDLTGRLRYLQADFLNLQRNAAREKEQTRDFAITRFASDLLETVDVLAIALKSIPESALHPPPDSVSPSEPTSPAFGSSSPPTKTTLEYLNDLHTGVEMTHRLLLQTLFKYHVKPFDPTGDKFDPNRHEALFQAPIPGATPGTVIDCQKVGYTIKDRTLRAAQVGVAQDLS